MDSRLVSGGLAIAAAAALTAASSTDAAVDDFADVPGNHIVAGVMAIDLRPAGAAETAASFEHLAPGGRAERTIWIANDAASAPPGTVTATVHRLIDTAAPCDTSPGKAGGEIASGIAGCLVSGDVVSGIPQQGNLSRVVRFDIDYGPVAGSPGACSGASAGTRSLLRPVGRGNLYLVATANGGAGTSVELSDGSRPLVLAPGDGVCVSIAATWPAATLPADPQHPSDEAAQGDSFTVGLRFTLDQALS